MDAVFYGFAVLVFAGVILLIEGGYYWWSGNHGKEARRIARRLRVMSGGVDANGERVSILKQRRYRWDPLESTCRHASLSIL